MYLSVRVERSRHMLLSRWIPLGLAAVGITAFTWGLVLSHTLFPILPRIIALIGSVIVVSVLYAFLALAAYKTIQNSDGWKWAVTTLVSLLACFLVLTFVINWGIGATVRSIVAWSWLPKGNLFEGSGMIGGTYLVLLITAVAVCPWSKLKRAGDDKSLRSLFQRRNFRAKSKKSKDTAPQTSDEDLNSIISSN